jgi:hypothetical protein
MANDQPELSELEQFRSTNQQFDSLDDRFSTQDETTNNNNSQDENEKDLEEGRAAPETKNGGPRKDPNLIVWDGPNDPENPMNWPTSKKWIITISLGMITFCVTFASSVFSTATVATAAEFGVSTEVSTLGTSLFVLGFAVGPLAGEPLISSGCKY